jgi:pSer/pThr/pTyr-binding forkhead associated (FHA) protein
MASPVTLKVFRGDELLRTERFEDAVIKIGRLASAHLRLEDDRVSRIHSVIEVAGDGRVSIVDMGSAAGTFVNGKRVTRGPLAIGDQITLGGVRIVVDGAVANRAANVAVPPIPAGETATPSTASAQPRDRAPERDERARGSTPTAKPTPTALEEDDDPFTPERAAALAAELRLYWGDVLLDAGSWVRPGEKLALAGREAPAIARVDGEYAIVPPGGAEIPIRPGAPVSVDLGGGLRVEARLGAAPPPARGAWWQRANWRFAHLVLVLGFVAAVLLVLGAMPGPGPASPAAAEESLRAAARFVAPPAPPPPARVARGEVPRAEKEPAGENGEKHRGAEGQMGRREAPKTQARSAPKAIVRDDREIVKQSGLLAVLGSGKGAPDGLSTVLGRGGLGGDLRGAVGNMFGATVGDSFGFGGLGLKGTGQGGGGGGDTIGIGAVGTKGRGGGMGGYGAGVGGLGSKADRDIGLAAADPRVLGAIDPELIRRVIREHASQVRYCYEQQLALNPRLQGKVSIRWQIESDGRVTNPQVEAAETTLASVEVQRCIVSRIVTWEFPKPRGGGIAIVKYPWILRTAGGGSEAPGA